MPFAKGAFSRHVLNRVRKNTARAAFGSRHAARRAKRGGYA